MDPNHYTYRITWSEEDGEYVGLCAEFPSLSHLDEDRSSALEGICALVCDVVEDLKTSQEPIPEPIADRKYSGNLQLRMPPHIHRKLVTEAMEEGVSLNRYINSKLGA
ncbi:toxin-antitoxin system HicB family antitoxin [Oscillatoria sp. FACHB-1406]|nr:toxin-antitoxin system HicB family antitoxin [Oscillatoria sp. FACHB-1406]